MSSRSSLFVLLALALCLITVASARRSNYYTLAAQEDEVINLPDAPQWHSKIFSGYLDVANSTSSIFYFFVEAKNDPANAPVLFWTNGGPFCSGLLGLFTEMGPYQPVSNGKGGAKLEYRTVSWNEDFNIFYVEQPDVGFTKSTNGPAVWTDGEVARRNADSIESFFKKFPQYKNNEFGIASESYGGHYIPWLNRELLTRINTGALQLNYKWSIVGNPLIYLPMDDFGAFKSQINRQIIPTYPLGKQYLETCTPDLNDFSNPPLSRPSICDDLERQMSTYTHLIDPYAMSFPICVGTNGKLQASGHGYGQHIRNKMAQAQKSYGKKFTAIEAMELHQAMFESQKVGKDNVDFTHADPVVNELLQSMKTKGQDSYFPDNYQACEEDYTTMYLNRKDVQKAIHANLKRSAWSMCDDYPYDNFDFVASTLPVFEQNNKIGPQVKQLIFSGSDDTVCSTVEAQMVLFNNFKVGKTAWEEISHEGQLVGFKTDFSEPANLVLATIHGAGHMCPSTRPAHTYELLKRFTRGKL